MFTNESTENLLDNFENELTEVIELDNPQEVAKEIEQKLPIPSKRNFAEGSEDHLVPVPAARRLQSLDKNEKNDENEIIQLSSMSSSSASENVRNISQNTVVASGRKAKTTSNKILVVHEAAKVPTDETFFVIKHGKWAQDEKSADRPEHSVVVEIEPEALLPSPAPRAVKPKPHLEIVAEKPAKKVKKKIVSSSSATTVSQTTFESTSESSSSASSEESAQTRKKSKKKKSKEKKKLKKKLSSDDQATSTEDTVKDEKQRVDCGHTIGIFLHSTGTLKFDPVMKSPRVKISFYSEDSGKQIGDSKWSKHGNFNDDFHNLICSWNEMLVIEQDFNRLREIYNNVLVFFEVINSDGITICWAFLKLFSQQFTNIDDKFQLQFFDHRKLNRRINFLSFGNRNQSDLNIFEQWRLTDRRKFPGILSITVKILNQKQESETVMEAPAEIKKPIPIDSINRKWQKLPGQACKIPTKVLHKLSFHDKGSMNVKFSQDGNLVAFSEVTKDCSVLHIQKFPEMLEVFTMFEHSDLVHDIDWLKLKQSLEGSQWMLTCSSDFTAIVWKLELSCYTYNILPHPSFVYASKFLQNEDSSKIHVVTAGRDCIIRIWQMRKKLEGFELTQELKPPNWTKSSYITAIATRNAETFYSSSSSGDIIEWTLRGNKEYHLNRHFQLDEISGKIVSSLELHPRGNKIFLRVQDFASSDVTGTIFVLGVPTGLITQKHQQPPVSHESQGKLKVTSCGSHLFASNGTLIRFYSLSNGILTSSAKNFLKIKIPTGEKISSIDYHPKDFYFACSIYGRNGGVVICSYESDDKDLIEKLKYESNDVVHKSQVLKPAGTHFSDIIRKLDEVFLTPLDSDLSKRTSSKHDDNTFSIDSKRSRTYTVSQGPATYTIQKNQNNTYDIQRKDESDEDATTISESFN